MIRFLAALLLATSAATTDVRITALEERLRQRPSDNALRDQLAGEFIQKLREFCASRGISFFSVSSVMKLEDLLLKQLRASEVWA